MVRNDVELDQPAQKARIEGVSISIFKYAT